MTRGQSRNNQHKPKDKLSQTPEKDIQQDGMDMEFSKDISDLEDKEAQSRSRAADKRAREHDHS
ncbi:YfhD family protein [Salibacterium halotolerans]|uniref:YfhD-like protein n=1 Tax=Salibacterium halotolerans TaxID=1884432 RepID=A0A1I5QHD1_9BACI|nr:YfhD family protein [Salibacterium halotolerans]SFP45714.1 YfhD-like protein [Salibacterium halotolerans]